MELKAGERIDYVNDKLSLIQNEDGLTFGTDALLLAGYVNAKYSYGIELGGGSGIISMLLLTRDKLQKCDSLEVQEEYAALIERNAELNGLSDRLRGVICDLRHFEPSRECDIVFTNPPYMKSTSGKLNESSRKNQARHEINGDISDFCKHGAAMLKYGGAFYAVYRPDRMTDLLCAMRSSGIEPKRLTLVFADKKKKPSMLLCEGKKGAKGGLIVTPPLLIYKDLSHVEYSDEMNYIMDEGRFPLQYGK